MSVYHEKSKLGVCSCVKPEGMGFKSKFKTTRRHVRSGFSFFVFRTSTGMVKKDNKKISSDRLFFDSAPACCTAVLTNITSNSSTRCVFAAYTREGASSLLKIRHAQHRDISASTLPSKHDLQADGNTGHTGLCRHSRKKNSASSRTR